MAPKTLATKTTKFEAYVPVISRFCGSSKHIGDLPDYESSLSRSAAPSPPGEFTPFHHIVIAAWLVDQLLLVDMHTVVVIEALAVVKYPVVVEICCRRSYIDRFDPRSQHSYSRVTQAD